MPDQLRIEAETDALLVAMDRFAGPVMERHVLAAAEETGDRIVAEALARVRRRTGQTARGIVIERAHVGTGVVVSATNVEQPNLPSWLEFGTQHMKAYPFFFASARLESGAHDRRLRDAIAAAAEEVGLGG